MQEGIMFKLIKLFIVIVLSSFSLQATQTSSTIIENIQIEPAELEFAMSLSRQSIFSYFNKKYHVGMSADFWHHQFPEGSPHEKLKKSAIEEIKHWRSIQLLALKYDVIQTVTSFTDLMQQRESVNKDRKIKKSRNQVLFGPVQYSVRTFHSLTMSNLIYGIRQSINPKSIPSAEMHRYYHNNFDQFKKPDFIDIIKVSVDNTCLPPCLQQIQTTLSLSKSIPKSLTGAKKIELFHLDAQQLFSEKNLETSQYGKIIEKMTDGQVSAAIIDNEQRIIIKRVKTTQGEILSFQDSQHEISVTLIEKLVKRLISEKIQTITVKVN